MRRAAKTDSNQQEIVKALRSIGAHVLLCHQLKNAFDILVGYRGKLFIIEIKDGSLPPSKRRLTEGEQKCADGFASVGVKYYIAESVDDAIKIVCENDK